MKALEHTFGELADVHFPLVETGVAGLEVGQRKYVLDQEGQPVRMILDLFEEPMGERFCVCLGVEQRLDVSLDDRERCSQLVADIGHEFLTKVLQSLESGEVVEDKDGTPVLFVPVADGHPVDLQELLVEAGQHDFLLDDLVVLLQEIDQLVYLVDTDGLHHGSVFWIVGQFEQFAEGRIGKLDDALLVSDEHAFGHVLKHGGYAKRISQSCRFDRLGKLQRAVAPSPPKV